MNFEINFKLNKLHKNSLKKIVAKAMLLLSFLLIFQVAFYPTRAHAADRINVQVPNNSPKLNTNLTVIPTLIPNDFNPNADVPYTIGATNLTTSKTITLSPSSGKGASPGPVTLSIRAQEFNVGNNQVELAFYYSQVGAGTATNQKLVGTFSLNVQAASASGNAEFSLNPNITSRFPNITAEFAIVFNPGGTGVSPAKYRYTCEDGGVSAEIAAASAMFSCNYPREEKNYVVTAVALDNSGNVITGIGPAKYNFGVDANVIQGGLTGVQTGGNLTNNNENTIWGLVNKIIGALLQLVSEIVYFIFYYFIAPLIQAMLSIRTYTDTFVNVIYPGWEIIRNVCNLVFIAALIAIGLATLFRVESYKYRHLLVQLILAALLVNFSLVIAQAILGLADTLQSQFLPNNVEVIRSLARDLMVTNIRTAVWDVGVSQQSGLTNTATMFFYASLTVGSFLVFAAIAIFLVVRIVALWLLLMVSPVAYVAGVLPSTAGFRGQWWSYFIKYAFFTPLMAFFLNLTAVISSQTRAQSLLQTVTTAQLGDSAFALFVFKTASNVILLVFLLASLKVAEEFGVMGAGAVTQIAKQGMFLPFAAPAGAAKWVGEKAANWGLTKKTEITQGWADKGLFGSKKLGRAAFAATNMGTLAKQFSARSEKRKHDVEHLAEGAAKNIVSDFWKEPSTDTQAEAAEHMVAEAGKELPYGGERGTIDRVKQALATGKKDWAAQKFIWGQIFELARNKGMNQLLLDLKYDASREGFVKFMNQMEADGYGTDAQISHYSTALSKIGYNNDEGWYSEMYTTAHGHPHMIKYDFAHEEVEGKHEFDQYNQAVEDRVLQEARNEQAIAAQQGRPITFQKALATVKANTELMEALKQSVVTNGDDLAKYKNYEGFIKGSAEVSSNFSKLDPQAHARGVHWSHHIEIDHETNGFSSPREHLEHMLTVDNRIYGQGNRMQPKKATTLADLHSDSTPIINAAIEIQKDKFEEAEISRIMEDNPTFTVADARRELNTRRTYVDTKAEKFSKFKIGAYTKFNVDGAKYNEADEFKSKEFADLLEFYNNQLQAAAGNVVRENEIKDDIRSMFKTIKFDEKAQGHYNNWGPPAGINKPPIPPI